MSTSIVARIAYLASDVLVDSQSSSSSSSAFLDTFSALAKSTSSAHRPTVIPIPFGADPGTTLLAHSGAHLLSYSTTTSSSQILTRLILHLSDLSSLPVVLHLALKDHDLSDVLLLRSAVPFFLVSYTPQQAHDNALLASRIARVEKKAVIHAFYAGESGDNVEEIDEDKVLPYLLKEKAGTPTLSNGNGHTNGNGASLDSPTDPATPSDDPTLLGFFKDYELAALSTVALLRRPLRPFTSRGPSDPHTVIFFLGYSNITFNVEGVSFVSVSLVNPILPSRILSAIPSTAARVIVLEQIRKWSMKWTPFYLEVVSAIQQRDSEHRPIIQSGVLGSGEITPVEILKLLQLAASTSTSPSSRLQLGVTAPTTPVGVLPALEAPHVPKHETAYTKILTHLFGDRLEISNSPALVPAQGEIVTSPEFALGRVRGQLDQRAVLIRSVRELLESGDVGVDKDLHTLLSRWILAKDDGAKSKSLGKEIVEKLESSTTKISHPAAHRILALRAHFPAASRWIIGSDAWSYDLGSSGLHHAIASGLNVNVLILDTLPYSTRNSGDPHRRKHDVGLYAMNHGDVYVASVAVYSSYSQVLQSLIEADKFNGPSVVLAYLPYQTEHTPALAVLKETKLAVDAGYWPLYRWDPSKEDTGKEPFSLDSDAIKNELHQFLDRQNHLSQLVRSKPQMAAELVSSLGENVKEARKKRAEQSYNDLVTALDAPPLLILYGSDGGAAEKVAKRLAMRGTKRGLDTTVMTLDSITLEGLAQEEHVAFITSVAGQGEPPQNGRIFFKALNAAATRGEVLFPKLKYMVFGMGDSHYWPRPEDAQYYNKAGKDLDARLEKLGGQRVVELGLGNDQDADGPQTGYKLWEPLVWKVLGVDSVEVDEAEPDPITNEHIKAASQYLRGTIVEGLADMTTGSISAADGQLTKFHGIYQQDDRDIRDERLAQGSEPAFSFMIRVRLPGGVCTPAQWLQMDQISDEHGSGTFKITTRQTFQFHGVIKSHLKSAVQSINRSLLDTLAACGDVNR